MSGTAQTIVEFSLQNANAAKSSAQYIRFNQVFAEGDLAEGTSLSAQIGTQTLPMQMDVISHYEDGSVKSAILTIAAPAIAAGATVQGVLVASGTPAGTPVAITAALAHGYDLTVNMNIAGLGAVSLDAAQYLAEAVAGGEAEIIRQGALATEIRFDVDVTRALRVTFDVVTYADGSIATKVSFQNDAAMGTAGGAILYNSVSIVENGETRFSRTNLTQYQYQVWAEDVIADASAAQTLNVRHDIDYLEQTGAIWNYDLTASVGSAPSVPSGWTNVLGVNGLFQYMPTTGGRPDIGPTTEANARWLITQDASAANYALAQAEAAGSIPWHYYDAAKGHYLSVTDYPKLWIDNRGTQQPSQIAGSESGWTTDRAHSADVSYVAWLMTGDRYHLDMLNAQASWVIASAWNDPRNDSQGIVANPVEEVRAQAWALRTVQEAAYANPDGTYEQAYFSEIANNNWAYLRSQTTRLTAEQGEVHGYVEGAYRETTATAPWQQDFFASTTALAAMQGNSDARAVLKWEANFLSGRFLSPDINPYNGFNYSLNVYSSSGQALSTWADVAAATRSAGNYSTGPSSGYYAALAAMSNANIITVFAGGEDPTDHRVAADAMRAYGWILSAGMPDLRTDAQFQIAPRMPDGTQIGVTEMRVIAPTTANTTQTFTGSNVFVYEKGVGRTTLIGTAGADVLIDASTGGGDRLDGRGGDDYLIGGRGTNVFAPGSGQDYALILGGAARFEVDATSAGRLEIQGFRPGTDIIALTGSVSMAAIIASARADGYGGTLITISGVRTIRLDGILPNAIQAGIFDITGATDSGGTDPVPPVEVGTAGPDTLIGTSGADTMSGAAGNDEYIVNHASDVVTEGSGGGTDHVTASVDFTLPAYVEDLTLVGAARYGTGNALANVISGSGANDVLAGLGGNDTLIGGGGADLLNGGDDTDRLVGAAGNDTLLGGAGDDVLVGWSGSDSLVGGTGNDRFIGLDSASDIVVEGANGGTDVVTSNISYTLTANVENLTLLGTQALNGTGNDLANVISGNVGANVLSGLGGEDYLAGGNGNDTLLGGAGDDVLVGGVGADSLIGGDGNDRYIGLDSASDIVVEGANGGTDAVT
ncbi:calcium-binding protein, partial [Neoroseomonas lacus]